MSTRVGGGGGQPRPYGGSRPSDRAELPGENVGPVLVGMQLVEGQLDLDPGLDDGRVVGDHLPHDAEAVGQVDAADHVGLVGLVEPLLLGDLVSGRRLP